MINIKGYQTPSRDFKGTLRGHDVETDFDVNDPLAVNDNNYIFNLEITKPYVIGNNYYLGLFSVLSGNVTNVNFYNNKVHVKTSENHYGKKHPCWYGCR